MKGLLYKDVVTNRANIVAILFLLYAIICCMALAIFDETGNLGAAAVTLVPMGCIFVLNIFIPLIAMISGMTDNKTKWTKYVLALPCGHRGLIKEKYMLGLIGQGIGVALSLVLLLVIKLKLDITWKALSIYAIPVILGIGAFGLIMAIMLPIVLKKEKLAEKIGIAALFVIFFGVEIYICFGNIVIFGNDGVLLKAFMWIMKNLKEVWLVAGGIAVLGMLTELVSYKITVRTFLED